MDEALSMAVLVTVIMMAVAFGVALCLAVALIIAFCAALYFVGKAILRETQRIRQEIREDRRRAAELQAARERELQEQAKKQEELQKQLAEAREREEQERLRHEREQAARERLETEREFATQTILGWNQRLFIKQPSPDEINTMVEQSCRIQSHSGKYLLVTAALGNVGVALEWKAHLAGNCVPQVIGYCDKAIMFSEWAFAGRHSARLVPGRHVLAFTVNRGGKGEAEVDLSFEVFVPEESSRSQNFNQAVDATVKDFVDRANTVATAKRTVQETLAAQGADLEEIETELGRFEAQIHALKKESL